jgi:hypothetical protein
MKTLKQILSEFATKTPDGLKDQVSYNIAIQCTKEWLQQKRLKITKADAYNVDHYQGKKDMLDNLLAELEDK